MTSRGCALLHCLSLSLYITKALLHFHLFKRFVRSVQDLSIESAVAHLEVHACMNITESAGDGKFVTIDWTNHPDISQVVEVRTGKGVYSSSYSDILDTVLVCRNTNGLIRPTIIGVCRHYVLS